MTLFIFLTILAFYTLMISKKIRFYGQKKQVPFRSNLKLSNKNLIASNQNNELLFFDKTNGNLLKSFPTEETKLKINLETIFYI